MAVIGVLVAPWGLPSVADDAPPLRIVNVPPPELAQDEKVAPVGAVAAPAVNFQYSGLFDREGPVVAVTAPCCAVPFPVYRSRAVRIREPLVSQREGDTTRCRTYAYRGIGEASGRSLSGRACRDDLVCRDERIWKLELHREAAICGSCHVQVVLPCLADVVVDEDVHALGRSPTCARERHRRTWRIVLLIAPDPSGQPVFAGAVVVALSAVDAVVVLSGVDAVVVSAEVDVPSVVSVAIESDVVSAAVDVLSGASPPRRTIPNAPEASTPAPKKTANVKTIPGLAGTLFDPSISPAPLLSQIRRMN